MEKRISYSQFQQVKAVAKACDKPLQKMEPLKKKIEALANEYKYWQTLSDALEAGIVQILGFHVADLVKKVIEPTGATDPKTGKPIKTTKYIPTDIVTYDAVSKEYVITIPDPEAEVETETPVTEEPAETTEADELFN